MATMLNLNKTTLNSQLFVYISRTSQIVISLFFFQVNKAGVKSLCSSLIFYVCQTGCAAYWSGLNRKHLECLKRFQRILFPITFGSCRSEQSLFVMTIICAHTPTQSSKKNLYELVKECAVQESIPMGQCQSLECKYTVW